MSPRLSIIIPLYYEPLEITTCLSWLACCAGIEECEIILAEADEGASMPPLGNDSRLNVRVVRSAAGRGTQLNAAAACARAPGLVFLHVDTRTPRGFVRTVTRALQENAAGAFDLNIESCNPIVRIVSIVGRWRSRITRTPYGDQVQFVRTEIFRGVGGFPEIPIMEDVSLMERLHEHGHRVVLLRPPAVTAGRRWASEGAVFTTLRNWRIMLAYRSGLPPRLLRPRYRPQVELESDRNYLVVFHRALRSAGVKTRLASDIDRELPVEPEIGDAATHGHAPSHGHAARRASGTPSGVPLSSPAAVLYRAMLDDLLPQTRLRSVRTLFFVDDATEGEDYPAHRICGLGRSYPQQGNDLWERMDDALRRSIGAGAGRVVLVGSDIPGLTRRIVRRAFRLLNSHEVVVGPSRDGGFYLIGVRADSYRPEMLAHAAVRPDESAVALVRWCEQAGRSGATLETLQDVDRLRELDEVMKDKRVAAPRLRAAVGRLGRKTQSSGIFYTDTRGHQ